jgi:Cu+-exporting ATPase
MAQDAHSQHHAGCCHGTSGHRAHQTGPAATAVLDPVCGMTVDPHTAKHRHDHEGHT